MPFEAASIRGENLPLGMVIGTVEIHNCTGGAGIYAIRNILLGHANRLESRNQSGSILPQKKTEKQASTPSANPSWY
jgi:hypothetical protein